MDVGGGLKRKLSAEELMLLNCGVGELFRGPWTAKRSNQSILKEINPEYSLEGLMLKLKHQYVGHMKIGDINISCKDGHNNGEKW